MIELLGYFFSGFAVNPILISVIESTLWR